MTVMDIVTARVLLQNVDAALNACTKATFPTLIITKKGNLKCPWCETRIPEEDGIYELDACLRQNGAIVNRDDDRGGGTLAINEGERHFDTVCYVVECCILPVELPEGWDSAW